MLKICLFDQSCVCVLYCHYYYYYYFLRHKTSAVEHEIPPPRPPLVTPLDKMKRGLVFQAPIFIRFSPNSNNIKQMKNNGSFAKCHLGAPAFLWLSPNIGRSILQSFTQTRFGLVSGKVGTSCQRNKVHSPFRKQRFHSCLRGNSNVKITAT